MTVSPDSDFFPVWKDARGWDGVLDVPALAVPVDGLVVADVPDSTVPVLVDVLDLILFPDVCFRCWSRTENLSVRSSEGNGNRAVQTIRYERTGSERNSTQYQKC